MVSRKRRLEDDDSTHVKRFKGFKRNTASAVKAKAKISAGVGGFLEIIDTFDRPGTTFTQGLYADSESFADGFEHKPKKRIPKAGLYAAAGVGLARAEWSCCEAEVKGPNAGAELKASAVSGVSAFVKAEVVSASATVGPVKGTVSLDFNTGISVGLEGIEVKWLGNGFSVGKKISASLFGFSTEFTIL